jgi:hypothetical protein
MKLVASLIATAAMTFSVLVAVPTTATAAPYPGTVATTCSFQVPGSVRKGHKLFVTYRVRASGNAHPSGVVKIRVYRVKRNGSFDFNRLASRSYTGPAFKTTSVGTFKKKGKYATKIWFVPRRGSVYKSSHSAFHTFRVKR